MDIMAVPCGYKKYDNFDECNWDKAKLKDYLGSTFIVNFYFNLEKLDLHDFEESKLSRVSNYYSATFGSDDAKAIPTWI